MISGRGGGEEGSKDDTQVRALPAEPVNSRGGEAATAGYEMRILAQFATHSNSCTQQTVTVTALWGYSPQLPHKTGHLKPAKRAESINRSNKNAKGNLTKIAHNLPNSRCAYPTALLPLPLLSLSLSAATQDESPRTPR